MSGPRTVTPWVLVGWTLCGVGMVAASILEGVGDRPPPTSTTKGLSDQTEYVALDQLGAVVAFGDFDGDRFVDVLAVDPGLRKLNVGRWNHTSYAFELHGRGLELDFSIATGIAVADFNDDGLLDIIMSDTEGKGSIYLNSWNETGSFSVGPVLEPFNAGFVVVDAENDLVPDVFIAYDDGERGFFVNSPPGSFAYEQWEGFHPDCKISERNSNAYVDLDGDCLADLVITSSCGLEVWSNPGRVAPRTVHMWSMSTSDSELYREFNTTIFPTDSAAQAAFGDFNGDGTMDVLFPETRGRKLIHLANVQEPRRFGRLCVSDPNWTLVPEVALEDFVPMETEISSAFVSSQSPHALHNLSGTRHAGGTADLPASMDASARASDPAGYWPSDVLRSVSEQRVPPTLRIGDFDLDGESDFVAVNEKTRRLEMYRNMNERGATSVQFEKYDDEAGIFEGLQDVVAGAFFDIDDSGRQDIIVVQNRGRSRLVWNNNKGTSDFLFFKATGLSGQTFFQEPRPFAAVPGNTVSIIYDDENGHEFRICSQCPQAAYLALQRCHCYFGLRRVVNYIGEMTLGAGGLTRSWQGLMPNSMALVWPDNSDGTRSWWMEYFTQRRGGQMLGVVIVLTSLLVVLGIVILWMSWRQRVADRKEMQQNSELFGFANG